MLTTRLLTPLHRLPTTSTSTTSTFLPRLLPTSQPSTQTLTSSFPPTTFSLQIRTGYGLPTDWFPKVERKDLFLQTLLPKQKRKTDVLKRMLR
ncbi:hypothetical protein HK097_005724, partial [Rhizophlyctis rosea]